MKGQSSLEFLAMVSMSLLLVTALYGFVAAKSTETSEYRNGRLADRVGDNVGFQAEMALVQGEGYSRVFSLPDDIAGSSYNVSLESGFVIVDYAVGSDTGGTLYNGSKISFNTSDTNTFRVLNNESGVFIRGIK